MKNCDQLHRKIAIKMSTFRCKMKSGAGSASEKLFWDEEEIRPLQPFPAEKIMGVQP